MNKKITVLWLLYFLVACSSTPDIKDVTNSLVPCQWMSESAITLTKKDIIMEGFTNFSNDIEVSHDYLVCNKDLEIKKPPVILLHEILGVEPKTIAYAKILAENFTVYVPRLMGEQGEGNSLIKGFSTYKFTWFTNEWEQQKNLEDSMLVTQWLHKFIKEVVEKNHPKKNIGIIGNCLTGALPLALLSNKKVTGVVLAQPSLPISLSKGDEDLEISNGEWAIAKHRLNPGKYPLKEPIEPAKAYMTRFGLDNKSPIKKYEYLARELGSGIQYRQITKDEYKYKNKDGQLVNISYCAHSSLIRDWQNDPSHPSEKRRKEIKNFMLDINR